MRAKGSAEAAVEQRIKDIAENETQTFHLHHQIGGEQYKNL